MIEKAREYQKNIYFCFIDSAKAFDCVDHNKLWKILKEMGIPDHLTCLLRNLYAGHEAIELGLSNLDIVRMSGPIFYGWKRKSDSRKEFHRRCGEQISETRGWLVKPDYNLCIKDWTWECME